MTNYLSRLYYAKLRYLEFPGSAVIQDCIPGTNVLANIIPFEFLFNNNLQKIDSYCKILIHVSYKTLGL